MTYQLLQPGAQIIFFSRVVCLLTAHSDDMLLFLPVTPLQSIQDGSSTESYATTEIMEYVGALFQRLNFSMKRNVFSSSELFWTQRECVKKVVMENK